MSYISDFKSSPFALFGVNGIVTSTDTSLATIVGTRFSSADGRTFVIVQNGGTALPAGVLVQGPATIGANTTGLAVAAAAATGATSVSVTNGGTALTANEFQGGWFTVSAGTGAGQNLRISSHASGTATENITFKLEDPLSTNLDISTSKVTLNLNQYGSQYGSDVTSNGVVISPSGGVGNATGQTIGVTYAPIAASSATVPTYGFIQSYGAVACLSDSGAPTAGFDIMPGAVKGSITTFAASQRNRVGFTIQNAESTKKQLIFVQL